jgi:CRISPR system Cascade subunit CasB
MIADAATAAHAWWTHLQPQPPAHPGNRAALAGLRRCATVAEAMQEHATLSLFRRLGGTRPEELPQVALAAAVLAHVRQDAAATHPGRTTARQIGPDTLETPDTALMKPLRFRRLMEAESDDDRLTAFRRLAALARGELPVRDLAFALLRWNDTTRRRWVFDYWNVAAPQSPPALVKDISA